MPTRIISENTTGDYTGYYTGVIDNSINEATPEENRNTEQSLYLCGYGGADEFATLIKFTGLSNITGPVTVSAATIGFYLDSAGGDATVTINVHRVLRDWSTTGACWSYYTGTTGWTEAGAKDSGTDISATLAATLLLGNTTGAWYTWSSAQLAQEVEDWINGVNNNYGLLFHPSTAADAGRVVRSSDNSSDSTRPYLELTYTVGGVDIKTRVEVEYNRKVTG